MLKIKIKYKNMTSLKFLEKYVNAYSAVSYETVEGQKVWVDYISNFVDKVYDDNYGNVVGVINPDASFKVVIDAHADEISWFISHIDKNGNIFVKKNGGSDVQIAPSKNVLIYTQTGKIIPGVFGWIAVHIRKDLKLEENNIWIDIGATSKKEVEDMGIQIGDVAIFDEKFRILNGNKYVGKSLDDKIGGYITSQVLKKLFENKIKLPYGLYIVNSVQEEIGLRGAEMITQSIKPNVAIILDGCHETTSPHINTKEQGELSFGDGVVFTHAPAIHRGLLNLMIDVAKENNIKFKMSVKQRNTGTNTDSYAYSNGGVVSNLVSISMKYMHTTCEMVHEDDVNSAIELIYHTLLKIENDHDFRYLKL
jgi:putative aminopeptidase FrvX